MTDKELDDLVKEVDGFTADKADRRSSEIEISEPINIAPIF